MRFFAAHFLDFLFAVGILGMDRVCVWVELLSEREGYFHDVDSGEEQENLFGFLNALANPADERSGQSFFL